MRRLFIFFNLAYLISWLLWLPLYGSLVGFTPEYTWRYQHALGALGPLIAAIICTRMFDGPTGLKHLLRDSLAIPNISLLLIALLSPFILDVGAIVIHLLRTGNIQDISKVGLTKEFPEFNAISFFIYNLVFFGFGEEVGWRGFALPRLQKYFNALNSSLLLSLFWALWHWPLFLYRPGYVSMDIFGILGWVLSLFTGSILLTWLFNSSRGSILACAIFHSAVDVAFTSDYLDKSLVAYMGMLITLWGLATIVVFKPTNLSRTARVAKV